MFPLKQDYTKPYSESVTYPCKSFGVAFLEPPESSHQLYPRKPDLHGPAHCLIVLSSVFDLPSLNRRRGLNW